MPAARPTLFKLSGDPLGRFHTNVLTALNLLQHMIVKGELLLRPLLTWLFRYRNTSFYAICRSEEAEEGFEGANILFKHVAEIFQNAQEIKIAAGELGHPLMERSPLVNHLERAYYDNQTRIEIIHGPRVDPQTRHLFELEREGVIRLFRMPTYRRHHFMLVTGLDGQVTAIDEGIHYGAVWLRKDRTGDPVSVLTDKARFYYITTSDRRVHCLREEYERRKAETDPTTEHPGVLSPPQEYSLSRILGDVGGSLLLKYTLQPLSVFLDQSYDLLIGDGYKEVSQDGDRTNGLESSLNGSGLGPRKRAEEKGKVLSRTSAEQGVISFGIDITVEQISASEPCELCEESMARTLLTYELPYRNRGRPCIARCDRVPGYRCDSCDLEFYDLHASIAVLEQARRIAQEARDETTLERIEASLEAGRRHLARFS